MTVPNWGDVPTWIAAVGTVSAFAVTWRTLIVQRRALDAQQKALDDERTDRQKLDKRLTKSEADHDFLQRSEQARLIGAYASGGGQDAVSATLINKSLLPVHLIDAVAFADDPTEPSGVRRLPFINHQDRTVVLPAGESPTYAALVGAPPGLRWRLEIVFSDDNGQRWHKYGSLDEPLRMVPPDFLL